MMCSMISEASHRQLFQVVADRTKAQGSLRVLTSWSRCQPKDATASFHYSTLTNWGWSDDWRPQCNYFAEIAEKPEAD